MEYTNIKLRVWVLDCLGLLSKTPQLLSCVIFLGLTFYIFKVGKGGVVEEHRGGQMYGDGKSTDSGQRTQCNR